MTVAELIDIPLHVAFIICLLFGLIVAGMSALWQKDKEREYAIQFCVVILSMIILYSGFIVGELHMIPKVNKILEKR